MVGGREGGRAPPPPESLQGPLLGHLGEGRRRPPQREDPQTERGRWREGPPPPPETDWHQTTEGGGGREHGEKRGTRKAVRQRPPSLLPWLDGREGGKKGRMLIIFPVPFGG